MIATEDEMVKAKLPLKYRDYCAHYYISYLKCKRDAGRLALGSCGHEKHEWEHCQYEDFVMRYEGRGWNTSRMDGWIKLIRWILGIDFGV